MFITNYETKVSLKLENNSSRKVTLYLVWQNFWCFDKDSFNLLEVLNFYYVYENPPQNILSHFALQFILSNTTKIGK